MSTQTQSTIASRVVTPKIPLLMHRTGPFAPSDIPAEFVDAMHHSSRNLGASCLYYNDDACRKLVKQYFSGETMKAYDMLIPTAYKNDLFEYCVLYVHGGIYCALSQKIVIPYDVNKDGHDMILAEDRQVAYPNVIQISFMAIAPKSPFLAALIDQLTRDILARKRGRNHLDVTGPGFFGNFFCSFFQVHTIERGTHVYRDQWGKQYQICIPIREAGGSLIFHDGRLFCYTKSKHHEKLLYTNRNTTKYNVLWNNNALYTKGQ